MLYSIRYSLVLLVCLVASNVWAAPKLVVEQSAFDFGEIRQGALDGSVPHPGLYSQNASYPEDYIIEGNNVFGNHRYAVVLRGEVPDDVIMVGNYWGTGNLARITEALFDGHKDEYLGKVLFPPFAEDPS